jgi:RNA polymerase sigma-70 factor (ECF subfamily)
MINGPGEGHLRAGASMGDERLALAAPAIMVGAPATEAPDARLRRMVRDHGDGMWRFMRRLGVLEMDLDDAMQEVIVVAAERLSGIPPASERSFLFSTSFRVASEWRRRRLRRREVGDEELAEREDPAADPDALSDQSRARALFDQILAKMPEHLRPVFVLHEIEDMTMAEIAQILSLAPGTVASRLRKARETFDLHLQRLQARLAKRPCEVTP